MYSPSLPTQNDKHPCDEKWSKNAHGRARQKLQACWSLRLDAGRSG